MPLRQIRKNKISKSKSQLRKRKTKLQRGGDPGRVALPMSYFSKNNTSGYYANGSDILKGCSGQKSVSRGVISSDGYWAGPNLFPQLGGRQSNKRLSSCNGSYHKKQKKTLFRKH